VEVLPVALTPYLGAFLMKAKLWLIWGVATLAVSAGQPASSSIPFVPSTPLQPAIADLEPNCAANPYGIDGQLSAQDLRDLFYLAFPQTAIDMRGRFGSPRCFDAVADYYLVEDTTHWVVVDYNGALAVNFRLWEEY
jgi:hypothetical protein